MDLITVSRRKGLEFEVRVRDRSVVCDMAPEDGGRGAGFSPAELFAGALGACIAMAVQGWAEACEHGTGDVAASVVLELRPDPKRIAGVAVDVELPAGIPTDRKAAVGRVVEHCLIQQTLRNPPDVDVDVLMEN